MSCAVVERSAIFELVKVGCDIPDQTEVEEIVLEDLIEPKRQSSPLPSKPATSTKPTFEHAVEPLHPSSSKLIHPDILHHVLLHLSVSSLASVSRVTKLFNSVASPILYRSIGYYPDRKGPTALDGLDDTAPAELSGSPPQSNKQRMMRYVRHLSLGYHHHDHPHTPVPTLEPVRYSSTPLDLSSNLRTLHIAGERHCTRRCCPFLAHAQPDSVVVRKIDLFSGSPRWVNSFQLPCAHVAKRAIYLVQSPFFVRADKWQGLSLESQQVDVSVFIFALREYEVEWRDTARRMSDTDAHAALIEHLSSICLMARKRTEIVGLELVAAHLRPREWLISAYPEDVVASFEEAVRARVEERCVEMGVSELADEQMGRCAFVSMREYAACGSREEEVERAVLDKWAACWEQNVACSGIARIRG